MAIDKEIQVAKNQDSGNWSIVLETRDGRSYNIIGQEFTDSASAYNGLLETLELQRQFDCGLGLLKRVSFKDIKLGTIFYYFSPEGRWIAYIKADIGNDEIVGVAFIDFSDYDVGYIEEIDDNATCLCE